MEILKISKQDFKSFINKKISQQERRVVGVVQRGSHYVFDDLESAEDMCLDYDVTILPPKKFFKPQKEVFLKYTPLKADSYQAENKSEAIAIVGIHYYDLAAIYLLDRAFSEGEKDEHYLKKRNDALLIGLFPTKHFKHRFSKSVIKDQFYKAADLMMIDMGDDFAIEIVTEKGKAYLEGSNSQKSTYTLKELDEAKNRVKDDQKLPVPHELTPDYLAKNYDHAVWKNFGDKCFSCGSCVLVCPTCYCFDVQDEVELSLKEGTRFRVWDSCMLEDFAVVAGNHNFRAGRGDRLRHRIFRKGKYLPEKYHYWGCVGCGRCADACTSDIAGPVKIFKYIEENK